MIERAPRVEAPIVQPKLEVGRADDPAEREADRVADQVLRRLGDLQRAPRSLSTSSSGRVRRGPATSPVDVASEPHPDAEVANRIRRSNLIPSALAHRGDSSTAAPRIRRSVASPASPVGPDGGELDAETTGRIRRATSGGAPLDAVTQQRMGDAFGADFSGIRVHEGNGSAELNRSLGARAFTTGSHVFLGAGAPAAGTREGDRLLAHELTHTIQQGGASVSRSTQP